MGNVKQNIKKVVIRLLDISFVVCCLMGLMFLGQLFCFTSFKIPSDSMEPALKDGDRILVNKMIMGARLIRCVCCIGTKGCEYLSITCIGNFEEK